MILDTFAKKFLAAGYAYLCARKPTDALLHDLVDALLGLIANRSGMKASLIVGDGVITRGVE